MTATTGGELTVHQVLVVLLGGAVGAAVAVTVVLVGFSVVSPLAWAGMLSGATTDGLLADLATVSGLTGALVGMTVAARRVVDDGGLGRRPARRAHPAG